MNGSPITLSGYASIFAEHQGVIHKLYFYVKCLILKNIIIGRPVLDKLFPIWRKTFEIITRYHRQPETLKLSNKR